MKKQKQTHRLPLAIQILAIIGCGSGEITLSGCLTGCTVECSLYDEICCAEAERGCDLDHDGYTTLQGDAGCDDDPEVNPGEIETCDHVDNNCDGKVDEGLDQDGDGVTTCAEDPDCDDNDAQTYPGAVEQCDGLDNDCDGSSEISPIYGYYLDQDGDAFGTEDAYDCADRDQQVTARGDCNDADSSIHPGAPDTGGDSNDTDCGGSGDADPSVGLEASKFTFIMDALNALSKTDRDITIWVGPGTYTESNIDFRGKAI